MFEYILLNILWNKNKENKETFLVSVQNFLVPIRKALLVEERLWPYIQLCDVNI